MESIRYDRENSNETIYHQRFKKVLETRIYIAGRGYEVRSILKYIPWDQSMKDTDLNSF